MRAETRTTETEASVKPIEWMNTEITTPPINRSARKVIGHLLWQVQRGETPPMPHSRPMPAIINGAHELRVNDGDLYWRVVYYIGSHRIAVLHVFPKKTQTTPGDIIKVCRRRAFDFLRDFDTDPALEGRENL